MQTVSKIHKKYNGSLFSEYELIGQSNLLCKYDKQKLVSGMRDHLNGQLMMERNENSFYRNYH